MPSDYTNPIIPKTKRDQKSDKPTSPSSSPKNNGKRRMSSGSRIWAALKRASTGASPDGEKNGKQLDATTILKSSGQHLSACRNAVEVHIYHNFKNDQIDISKVNSDFMYILRL